MMTYFRKNWLWLLTNIGAAIPLLLLAFNAATNNLGFDPIAEVTSLTGKTALIILVLSLAATPINIVTGIRPVLKLRKSLGLWAFGYALLHFSTYIGLDYALDWRLIFADSLLTKRYVFVGLTALLLLTPLALTSTKAAMKRLGKNWKRLHRLVYVAGGLAVLHFLWLVKIDRTEPLIYAAILGTLLLIRVPPVRKRIISLRRSLEKKQSSKPQLAS